MDYVIRCPACGHSVSQHSADGCYGENLQCPCVEDREGVLRAVAARDTRTVGANANEPAGADTA